MEFFLITTLVMAAGIFVIHKVTELLGFGLKRRSLALCAIMALAADLLAVTVSAYMTIDYVALIFGLVLVSAVVVTFYNEYLNKNEEAAEEKTALETMEDAIASVAMTEKPRAETAAAPLDTPLAVAEEMPPEPAAVHAPEPLALDIEPVILAKSTAPVSEPETPSWVGREPVAATAVETAIAAPPVQKPAVTVNTVNTADNAAATVAKPIANTATTATTATAATTPAAHKAATTVNTAAPPTAHKAAPPPLDTDVTAETLTVKSPSIAVPPPRLPQTQRGNRKPAKHSVISLPVAKSGADLTARRASVAEPPRDNLLELNAVLSRLDSLDDILDYAFEQKNLRNHSNAIFAYKQAIRRYRDNDYAPFIIIELGNLYKANGAYDDALKTYRTALSLPAVKSDEAMAAEFHKNIRYLTALRTVLVRHNATGIPFGELPADFLREVEKDLADEADSQSGG